MSFIEFHRSFFASLKGESEGVELTEAYIWIDSTRVLVGDWYQMKKKRLNLKDVELRIIAELIKNSRRSDRELARVIGCSQPTVSRTIERLEKEGIIEEYTMIPNFKRLGYQIMGVSFYGRGEPTKEKERAELVKAATEFENKNPHACMMAVNGIGLRKSRMFITFYKNYRAYTNAMQAAVSLPHLEPESLESLVDINESNYRLLSLKQVAEHIQSEGIIPKKEA
jgi:DNA-binding Lrp family transcriptional regulator